MRRRLAWIAIGGAIALLSISLAAQAQDANAPRELPWWGPESFEDGWNIRIPVTITNDDDTTIQNPPVALDVDVGDLALAAGWPSGTAGNTELLKSFRLQPESVRVVEYTNFQLPRRSPSDAQLVVADAEAPGEDRFVVPSRVKTSLLDQPGGGPFDPETNPIVSVTWIAQGPIEPGVSRTYMVHMDVLQNGERTGQDPEHVYDALGGLHWISRGHEVFASGETATVVGLHRGTRVSLFTYDGLLPVLKEIDGQQNPFTLDTGEVERIRLGGSPQPFRVTANQPVLATGQIQGPWSQQLNRDMGFLPSSDGTLVGTQFDAWVSPGSYYVYATSERGASGRLNGVAFNTEGDITRVEISGDTFNLEVDQPVLVQGMPDMDRSQFATLSGAPAGSQLVGTTFGTRWDPDNQFRVHDSGALWLTSTQDPLAVRGQTTGGDPRTIIPSSGSTVDVEPGSLQLLQQTNAWGFEPIELRAVEPSRPSELDPLARLVAFGGPPTSNPLPPSGPAPVSSPIGGPWGEHIRGPVDANVFGFYNDTLVVATSGDGERTVSVLQRGQRLAVSATSQDPFEVEANKPVAVVPTQGTAYGAGRLASPSIDVGELQYRGYLVSLRPASADQEPIVETASFGETVRFEVLVENRGVATDGGNLPDTVNLDLSTTPPGWNATLDQSQLTLDSGEARRVNLTVSTPETRDQGARLPIKVTATSENNPRMQAQVETVTLLQERRDVGIWYQNVDGPKELLSRFDPGETRTIPVVAMNAGSTKDALRFALTGTELGWSAELRYENQTRSLLPLGPGEQAALDLVVSAPPPGALARPTSLTVSAVSLNDTTATDKILFDGLVLAESKLELDAQVELKQVRPGELATFQLALANKGNASADVQLNASVDLPAGWQDPEFFHRGGSLSSVENRLTSVPPTGSEPVALELRLPIPETARGQVHLKILITATPSGGSNNEPVTLPVNLFVEPVVALVAEPPERIPAPPGRTTDVALPILNEGNINATIVLTAGKAPSDWLLEPTPVVHLEPGSREDVSVGLKVPAGTPPRNGTVELVIRLPNGTRENVPLNVEVPRWTEFKFDSLGEPRLVPGIRTMLTTAVTNIGNEPGTVGAEFSLPPGWNASARGKPAMLAPMESGELVVELLPPQGTTGVTNISLRSSVPSSTVSELVAPPAEITLPVRTSLPDLVVNDVRYEPGTGAVPPSLAVSITNEGNIEVLNVTVAAVADGERVSESSVSQFPPGAPRVVTLELPEQGLPASIDVHVDPLDRIPERNEGNNERSVNLEAGTDAVPWPTWWPVWIALATGAASQLGRRHV